VKFKIINLLPAMVAANINPKYVGFSIMQTDNNLSWFQVGPTQDELGKCSWYNGIKFIDPNEINRRTGYPPGYVIVDRDNVEKELLEFAEKNFTVEEWTCKGYNEYMFEGSFEKKEAPNANDNGQW